MRRARLRVAATDPAERARNYARRMGKSARRTAAGRIHSRAGILGRLLYGANRRALSNARHRRVFERGCPVGCKDPGHFWSLLLPEREYKNIRHAVEVSSSARRRTEA